MILEAFFSLDDSMKNPSMPRMEWERLDSIAGHLSKTASPLWSHCGFIKEGLISREV